MSQNIIARKLCRLARSLQNEVEGSEWYLFGSSLEGEKCGSDIDLMIICTNDYQADIIRRIIDRDFLYRIIHLSILTFAEEAQIEAIKNQRARKIYPI